MAFVFTSWYIVIAVLLVLAIGLIVTFILMDKRDREIIDNFIKESAEAQPASESADKEVKPAEEKVVVKPVEKLEEQSEVKVEETTEEKAEDKNE